MPKIILSTGLLHKNNLTLEDVFICAKEAGFDGLNYDMQLIDLWKKPRHILSLSKKYHLPILTLHAPLVLIFWTPQFLYQRLLAYFAFFTDTKVVNHHLSAFFPWLLSFISPLDGFVTICKRKNIPISFESNPKRSYLFFYPSFTSSAVDFAKFCSLHSLSITMDVSHISNVGYNVVTFFGENSESISLIHLSDYKNGIEHLPIGMGGLPMKGLLSEIKKKKWEGIIEFEMSNLKDFSTKREKLAAIKKSLEFVHKYL